MPKKRILMILEGEFPPDVRVEKEAQSLIEKDYEVHICSYNFSGKPLYELKNGMHIHRMTVPRQFHKKLPVLMNLIPVYQWIWSSFIKKVMRSTNFDVIHVHDLPLCGVGQKLAAIYNIPFIADMHENYPYLVKDSPYMKYWLVNKVVNFKKWLRLEAKWLNAANYIITTCEGMKQRLINSGIENSKIYVVGNTISLYTLIPEKQAKDPHKTILIYVGGISEDRGLQYALEGFHLLNSKKTNLEFWIVGEGRYRIHLEKLVAEKNIRGIKFWGWKNRTDTNKLLMQADIGIIPHIKSVQNDNSSPNKIFEYFLMARPVIVSNCESLVALIEESGAGVTYEYNSAESFMDSFLSLLQKDLVATGQKGRQIVLHKYNWENTQMILLDLYKHI